MAPIVMAVVPPFMTVTVFAALVVFTKWLPKVERRASQRHGASQTGQTDRVGLVEVAVAVDGNVARKIA